MLNQSCYSFIENLSSKEPVPGGGGASAYVASIGVALGRMVGNLTIGKKKYAEVEEDIQVLLVQAEVLTGKLNELVKEDAEAFFPLSKAYGMPVSTEEERKEKDRVLQMALKEAARVPMEIARTCVEAIVLHDEMAEKGSRLVISDVGCGVIFCKSALQGARMNVLINLKLMNDEVQKAHMYREIEELMEKGCRLADEIYSYVESQL